MKTDENAWNHLTWNLGLSDIRDRSIFKCRGWGGGRLESRGVK